MSSLMPVGERAQARAGARTRPLEFFKGFLRNPKEVGSVIPSSRFLVRRVLRCCALDEARVVVELGPGTGVLTREILPRLPADGRLVGVEINESFADVLERTSGRDPRFTLYRGCASDVGRALEKAGEREADLVVSGIPFSTLGPPIAQQAALAAREVLRAGGRFVAYQFRSTVRDFADPLFGPAAIEAELRNIPPMRVYAWKKESLDR